jgi:hypothetical protein
MDVYLVSISAISKQTKLLQFPVFTICCIVATNVAWQALITEAMQMGPLRQLFTFAASTWYHFPASIQHGLQEQRATRVKAPVPLISDRKIFFTS